MCIGVDASGSEEGKGTHVSVYANLMRGEYDDHLQWPFKGSISIELCNQRDISRRGLVEKIVFTYDAGEVASRVVGGGDIAEHGLGIPTFVEHAKLGFHTTREGRTEVQYLKNDCLKFRVLRVDSMERRNASNFEKYRKQ
jgi:TNF receptor-associated factor 4